MFFIPPEIYISHTVKEKKNMYSISLVRTRISRKSETSILEEIVESKVHEWDEIYQRAFLLSSFFSAVCKFSITMATRRANMLVLMCERLFQCSTANNRHPRNIQHRIADRVWREEKKTSKMSTTVCAFRIISFLHRWRSRLRLRGEKKAKIFHFIIL